LRPGTFGDVGDSGLIRIDGPPVTDDWIDRAIARASGPIDGDDLVALVVIGNLAAAAERVSTSVTPERAAKLAAVWPALTALLPKIDPVSQAWMLVVLPDTIPPLAPAIETLRSSPEKLVRLTYLIRRTEVSTDPIIDAALRSEDPDIARYGRVVKEMLSHDEEVVRRDFSLGTSGAKTPPQDSSKPSTPSGPSESAPPPKP
ncbi:MAG: hypothetical protein SGJ09_06110, partial [Phycisphaerae bacterium]|nr:hypothetical protein [Phycisphaerae bacterium]